MEKKARIYLARVGDYHTSRNALVFLMAFSLLNIGIYYLTSVPLIETVLEFLDFNNYLAPAASLPRVLFLWQADKGQWLWSVLLALAALIPFLLSWLLTDEKGKKGTKYKGWGFLPAVIWYVADTAFHLYGAVLSLLASFSVGTLVWEIIGLLIRVFAFCMMASGITAPKQIRRAWEDLVAQTVVCFVLEKGPEAAKQVTKEQYEQMARQYVNGVARRVNEEQLDAFVASLD